MNELRFALEPDRFQRIDQTFGDAADYLEQAADVYVAFKLDRDGTALFGAPAFKDPELEFASEDFARELGHDFGKWLVDQCYFFLRDVSHSHKHHAPTSDTILITQERDQSDMQWRKNIIFSLYYCIIKTRRFPDAESQFQSLGIHAYCLAFKGICQSTLGTRAQDIPNFDDNALRQSIQSKADEDVARRSDQLALAGYSLSKSAKIRTFAFLSWH